MFIRIPQYEVKIIMRKNWNEDRKRATGECLYRKLAATHLGFLTLGVASREIQLRLFFFSTHLQNVYFDSQLKTGKDRVVSSSAFALSTVGILLSAFSLRQMGHSRKWIERG
ncbi:hypothetical protein HPB48_002554 [Haemaphysalis longicornis]|uniref:Uncharacterized protein n=1 Tax=Haemaphysalis longicornis TaxID=44386 RepID=A0A9J6FY17_HAELO|nr:hypothetical protein HPB48_002554 [Haemaphysalis longicornis]